MEVEKPRKKSILKRIRDSRIAKKIKQLTGKKKSEQEKIRNDPKIKWVNNPDTTIDGEDTLRTIAYHKAATGNEELAKYMVHKERMKQLSEKEIDAYNENERKKTEKLMKQEAQEELQSLQAPGAPKLPLMLSESSIIDGIDGGTRRRKRKRRRKTKKKKKRRRRTKKKKNKRRRRTKKRRRK